MSENKSSNAAQWSPLIDTHAHIFEGNLPLASNASYSPKYDFTKNDYLKILDAESIYFGVLTAPSFLGTYNDYVLDMLASCPRLRGTAIVDPDIDPGLLRLMADSGIVGIRYSLRRYPDLPDFTAPQYQRLLRRVRDLDMYVHVLAESERLATLIPPLDKAGVKIVVDHFGVPEKKFGDNDPTQQAVLKALDSGRTWIKLSAPYRTSGIDMKALANKFLKVAGTERLLWGSDCPWASHEGKYTLRDTIKWFEDWIPDRAVREAIGKTGMALNKFI